ncbi:MAG: sulfite exporter TauE/SafE family protein [Armatimonadetes bacterium]|nr:sulfite exporter TauE/SafE family protein [Armatimonadota bacterium]
MPTELPERAATYSVFHMVVIGLVAGFFSGLLGVGGGLIMIPAMVLWLGVKQHTAHGTSLATMLAFALSGAISYTQHGNMNFQVAAFMALGGVIGATFGAKWANRLSGKTLKRMFGLFVIVTGIHHAFFHQNAHGSTALIENSVLTVALITFSVGLVSGIISGLLGVGGGIVMIPAMVYILGLGQKLAQGISLAVIIPVSISGAWIHHTKGNVDWKLAVWLGASGVTGALFASNIVGQIQAETLKLIFGMFLAFVGISMIRRKA